MSAAEEIAAYLASPNAPGWHELLTILDRASLGHSILRGIAHDLSNASQVLHLHTPEPTADGPVTAANESLMHWVDVKLNRTITILRDFATGLSDDERPVLVDDIVLDVQAWQEFQRAQPPIRVRTEVTPGLNPVRASESRLRQALLAVVANAKEAMQSSTGDEVVLEAVAGPGGVRLAVEDRGPGVAPDIVDRVCEPFFTTKDPEIHRGLGLTVAQMLVAGWGGRLTIQDGNEGGTRVELEIPYWSR